MLQKSGLLVKWSPALLPSVSRVQRAQLPQGQAEMEKQGPALDCWVNDLNEAI